MNPNFKQNPNILGRKPIPRKRPPKRFATFDIETGLPGEEKLGGSYVYGATYSPELGVKYFDTLEKLMRYILDHPQYEWFAHNAARYDYLYFVTQGKEVFMNDFWNVSILSSKLQTVGLAPSKTVKTSDGKTKHIRIQLKDFYRIMPQKLDDLTVLFDVEHKKKSGTIDWDKEYFDPKKIEHIVYLTHDVMGLYEVIDKFSDIIWEYFRTPIKWSAASIALEAWQRSLPKGHVYFRLSKRIRDFIHAAYVGGMVPIRYSKKPSYLKLGNVIYQEKELIAVSYDVNSMYPAQMRKGVPIGAPRHVFEYIAGKPGYYDVEIEVSPSQFPMVPSRNHLDGVMYATGVFRTKITSMELEYALNHGAKLIRVYEGYIFPKTEKIFDDFINRCERIRREYKGTALELVAKLMQNSLYGKFGSKEITTSLKLLSRPPSKGRWLPFHLPDGDIVPDLYTMQETIDTNYLHPEWAAWITASARLVLSEAAEKLGNRLIYGDTDSLTFFSNGLKEMPFEVDDLRYGAFKFEGEFDDFVVAAPKTYAKHFKEPQKDKKGRVYQEIIRAKGVPISDLTFDDIKQAASGETVSVHMQTLSSLSVLLKHDSKDPELKNIERTVTKPENVESFCFDSETRTWRPWDYQEYWDKHAKRPEDQHNGLERELSIIKRELEKVRAENQANQEKGED